MHPASRLLPRLGRTELEIVADEARALLAVVTARIAALDAAEDRLRDLRARAAHARAARLTRHAERRAKQAQHCARMREAKRIKLGT